MCAVGAKHTTIAVLGAQPGFTICASIFKQANIGGHGFGFLIPAFWARNY